MGFLLILNENIEVYLDSTMVLKSTLTLDTRNVWKERKKFFKSEIALIFASDN